MSSVISSYYDFVIALLDRGLLRRGAYVAIDRLKV